MRGVWNELLAKPENRAFVQAFLGNVVVLAVCSNATVWNALSYANSVSPLLASFSLSLALQEDSGQNVKYIVARTGAVSVGGAVGLLVLYVTYWSNGSSFENSVTKGSVFTVLMVCVLTFLVYFFRPPVWCAWYKAVLIGGIAVCLVGGDGYWSGDEPLPLIYAYILANMMIGLLTSYAVAHTVFPIRKSVVVRKELNRVLVMLKHSARAAVDALDGARRENPGAPNAPEAPALEVPTDVGPILIKCRVMLLASTHMEHRLWSCQWQFPVNAHIHLVVLLRRYLSIVGTLFDVIRSNDRIFVSQPGLNVLRVLGDEIEASLSFFEAPVFKHVETCANAPESTDPPVHNQRLERLERAVSDVLTYLSRIKNEKLFRETQGSSRAAMALLACLGQLVEEMYPVVAECFGEASSTAMHVPSETEMLTRSDTFPANTVPAFKHHRPDIMSTTARSVARRLNLKPQLLKSCVQASIALSTACVLLVCTHSYRGLGEHALWVLITVWVFSSQSTFGSVVLKAVNRVAGTCIAGSLAYLLIYLTYGLNGGSYANTAGKYVAMTILYSIAMAALHREMVRAKPQWKYCFYVSKVTLAITTLATFNKTSPDASVPAWRLLAVLIGIGIEFVVKTLVFYRESATTMRHRIQDVLESLARGGWRQPEWRATTAAKVNDLSTIEDLVLFEDKIAAVLHVNMFDRRLINRDSMPVLRRSLRLVLNRVLTLLYLETSIQVLSAEKLHVDEAVRERMHRAHVELIPACLERLSALFGGGSNELHTRAEQGDDQPADPFQDLIDLICEVKQILTGRVRSEEHNIAVLTWSASIAAVGGSLAEGMRDLRDTLVGGTAD